jgi:outer membrane protein assembly factor BamB
VYVRAAAAAVLLLPNVPPLSAQPLRDDRGVPATATLPESNEAMLLSSRVEEAVQRGDYRLAIELIDRIMKLPGELVAAPASRTYYPVWRQAQRLTTLLPPAGVELYRQLYDAEVAARFQQARDAADLDALRELFNGYRLSTSWGQIGRELVVRLLDQAAYGECIEILRELLAAGGADDVERRAQLAIALARVGALPAAHGELNALLADPRAVAAGVAPGLQALRDWLSGPAGGGTPRAALDVGATLRAPLQWSLRLRSAEPVGDDRELAAAVEFLRRLPLLAPVIADDVMVLRSRGMVVALDALTLTPLWSVTEIGTPGAEDALGSGSRWSRNSVGGRGDQPPMSDDTHELLTHSLRHTLTAGLGMVLTIEALASPEPEVDVMGRRTFPARVNVQPNELVARELRTGRLVWRTGLDAESPLAGVAFQDRPLLINGVVVAAIQRKDDLNLALIEPGTGTLLREMAIVGPPTHFNAIGGRALLAADETSIYIATGNGVVAAISRRTHQWQWATVYPSRIGEHLARLWWQPEVEADPPPIDRPVIADELLILAPIDSDDILALDRFSGRQRWRRPRGEYSFLVAALAGGLILGGQGVTCLDLSDGTTVRWKSVPLEVTGRPAMWGSSIFVPTSRGICMIDGHSGKLVLDQYPRVPRETERPAAGVAAGEATGMDPVRRIPDATQNLIASDSALFAVAPGRVVKYPDICATRACSEAAGRDGERHELALAWLDALSGSAAEALARLERLQPADSALVAARDQLLARVCIELARGATDGDEQLAWLRRAGQATRDSATAAELMRLVGQTLERAGRREDAVRHYADILLARSAPLLVDHDDSSLYTAPWLLASERMEALLAESTDADRAAFIGGVLEQARGAGEISTIQRLRSAVAPFPEQREVGEALMLATLPPELTLRIMVDDDPAEPPELRRRLHLRRWETHVALGMMPEAAADRDAWHERFAADAPAAQDEPAPAADNAATPPEGDVVARIELAQRKLEQALQTPNFTSSFARQWKVEDVELILDPRDMLSNMRPWIFTRNNREAQIELRRAVHDGARLRQELDAVGLPAQPSSGDFAVTLFPEREGEDAAGRRTSWPALLYEQVAVVPARGGIKCIGLGPERGGGRKLWEFAIRSAEWEQIPRDFADRAAACPTGLCIAVRPDRLIMLDWFDGQIRWQRDFPGLTIRRVRVAGRSVVAIADDFQAVAVSVADGSRIRRLPPRYAALRACDVIGESLLLWDDESVAACEVEDLSLRWTMACRGVRSYLRVAGREWVAWRVRGSSAWTVCDVRTGEPALARTIDDVGDVTAMVVRDDVLYVAGRVTVSDEDSPTRAVLLAAHQVPDGVRLWHQRIETGVDVNATQLAAHPEYIPLLRLGPMSEGELPDLTSMALELVERSSGRRLEPTPIGRDFKNREHLCGPYLLATPARMIVQGNGCLAAYGNSRLSPEP